MSHPLKVLPSRQKKEQSRCFPPWLHRNIPQGNALKHTQQILRKHGLNTVCEEAKCPNRLECYSRKTATFLALGKSCTRACGFCDIDFARQPKAPDPQEPVRIAQAVKELGLSHVVITMVARDDLKDHGAGHLVAIMKALRATCKGVTVELLTSDFGGNWEALDRVLAAKPEIFNYNLETVRRLTPRVRHKATYDRTLKLLSYVHKQNITPWIKSGIMVGLGEEEGEVKQALLDLFNAGCSIVTIGQYLQPSRRKIPVKSFIPPEQFKQYANYGRSIGIPYLYAGPFIRSSYNAALLFENIRVAPIP
jgi:lipoic acid synthetase